MTEESRRSNCLVPCVSPFRDVFHYELVQSRCFHFRKQSQVECDSNPTTYFQDMLIVPHFGKLQTQDLNIRHMKIPFGPKLGRRTRRGIILSLAYEQSLIRIFWNAFPAFVNCTFCFLSASKHGNVKSTRP